MSTPPPYPPAKEPGPPPPSPNGPAGPANETSGSPRRSRKPWIIGCSIALALAVIVLIGGCTALLLSSSPEAGSASTSTAGATEEPADDVGEASAPAEEEAPEADVEPAEAPAPEPDPEPEPEPEAEPEPEPEPVEPQSFSGSGSEVVVLEPLGEEVFFATVTHNGSRNVALWSVDENGQDLDLLVNEIGSYDGQVPINFSEDPAAIRVEADGEWTIELIHLSDAPRWDGGAPYEGAGDAVVIVDGVADGLTPVTLTHNGERNFAIWAWGESYPDLIVNDIGTYEGTTLLPDGSLVLQVTADGSWTISTE